MSNEVVTQEQVTALYNAYTDAAAKLRAQERQAIADEFKSLIGKCYLNEYEMDYGDGPQYTHTYTRINGLADDGDGVFTCTCFIIYPDLSFTFDNAITRYTDDESVTELGTEISIEDFNEGLATIIRALETVKAPS